MLGKLLITAIVVYFGFLAIRSRYQDAQADQDGGPRRKRPFRPPAMSSRAITGAAYGIVAVMVAGSGVYLFQAWERRQQLVEVQVINSYTGRVQRYQTRRGLIEDRSFRTPDGQVVRIAEMERLVIEAPR